MNTNILDFSDYDGQSFSELSNMKFLDFESLQKNQNNSLLTSEKNKEIERRNPLSYSPLSKNGNDVRDNFFRGSTIYNYGNFEFIVDPSSNFDPPKDLKIVEDCFFSDNNNSSIFGDTINNIQDEYLFTVKLFISKYKSQLEEVYNNPTVIPADDEILLFLENNSEDLSSSSMYIKKGKNITDSKINVLVYGGTNKKDKNGIEYSNYLKEIENEYYINYNELKEFLTTGKIESTALNIISSLFGIASVFISAPFILQGVSIIIEKTANNIKNKCAIEEKSWNPKAIEPNSHFKPFLFEDIADSLDKMNDDQINKFLKSGFDKVGELIYKYDEGIIQALKITSKIPVFLPIVPFKVNIPDSFSQLLIDKYSVLRITFYKMLENAKNIDFSYLGKEAIYIANAFICGIWNGFVEAVCGIISLVGYLFQGAATISDLFKNFKTKGPEILEKIDDITMAFHNLDFNKIFSKLWSSVKEWLGTSHSVSLVEIAYFSGAFIGFLLELVIEIVVGILFTGGTVTVAAITGKLAEFFVSVGKLLSGIIKLPYTVAKKSLSIFINGLHWLYEFLAKGTDEIIKIIDEVFAKLSETEKLIDQQVKFFIKKLPSNIGKFVDLLTQNFPKLQKKIVDGLLVLEFQGKTLMKINPKGIITEIKYFRELDGRYVYFTELKNVKIELEVVDDLGRKTIKKYEDTVEVMKKGDDVGFRAKFEEGKVRDGEYINYTFERSGNYNPFAVKPTSKSKVIDKVLKEGDEFYIVEFKDRTLQREVPGAWASNYEVKSIKELREKLQVLKEFKDEARGELVVRKYRVKAGKELPSREGYIGDLETGVNKGPKQWEFMNAWEEKTFKSFIEEIDAKTLK